MFGYINPDAPYLFIKDEKLYKALYCGMCKSIGKGCGNCPKSALTYDVAFMSALMHNIAGKDVVVKKKRCFLHIFKRRLMAIPDDLSILLGCMNTALAYYKLLDDKKDGDKKGVFAFIYKRGYKKAIKRHPELAKIISSQMTAQRQIEDKNSAIIEEACEPTAVMLERLSRYCLKDKATEYTSSLMYAVGKWIYLADALDDYDKDVKKRRYNVFYNAFKTQTKAEAVEKNKEEITFIFDGIFAQMRTALNNIKFNFNHDLTDNIILRGIPIKTRAIVYGKCGKGKGKNEQKES